jgi:hypothetical protein
MISHKHNAVMIHIPRTGGMSRRRVIKGVPGGHATAADYVKRLGLDKFESMFSFSFVRNPWDREVSNYTWLRRKRKHLADRLSFHEWCKDWLDLWPWLKRPQIDFLTLDGTIVVNRIARFEAIGKEWQDIARRIGIRTLLLPHYHNRVDGREHYSTYYDDECRDLIATRYATDILTWGYEFEDRR